MHVVSYHAEQFERSQLNILISLEIKLNFPVWLKM
jgi:hypothetical protein